MVDSSWLALITSIYCGHTNLPAKFYRERLPEIIVLAVLECRCLALVKRDALA